MLPFNGGLILIGTAKTIYKDKGQKKEDEGKVMITSAIYFHPLKKRSPHRNSAHPSFRPPMCYNRWIAGGSTQVTIGCNYAL